MSKIAKSLKVDSFSKCIKKDFDSKDAKKIYQTIERFEQSENDFLKGLDPNRQKVNLFGKSLSRMGQKDIYCLEIGTDRALAKIVEQDNVKVFVWFWAGSHEKYNNVLKQIIHQKPDPQFESKQMQQIIEQAHAGEASNNSTIIPSSEPHFQERLSHRRQHSKQQPSREPAAFKR